MSRLPSSVSRNDNISFASFGLARLRRRVWPKFLMI